MKNLELDPATAACLILLGIWVGLSLVCAVTLSWLWNELLVLHFNWPAASWIHALLVLHALTFLLVFARWIAIQRVNRPPRYGRGLANRAMPGKYMSLYTPKSDAAFDQGRFGPRSGVDVQQAPDSARNQVDVCNHLQNED